MISYIKLIISNINKISLSWQISGT